ncbi:hypothetical protein AGLY_009907, partial [Aphis glycines]
MSTYNLDTAHYYTASGLNFDAMLKYTGQKLELLCDYDVLLMFENGNNLYGYAMLEYMPYGNFNCSPVKINIQLWKNSHRAENWSKAELFIRNQVKWVEPNLDGLSELTPKSARGRVYEVDISYPQHLHDKHNDLPFLPQNSIPQGSKVRKLMATFERKENYIVHYRNLQQAIDNGLIVEK